jgi:hypothetical protein
MPAAGRFGPRGRLNNCQSLVADSQRGGFACNALTVAVKQKAGVRSTIHAWLLNEK